MGLFSSRYGKQDQPNASEPDAGKGGGEPSPEELLASLDPKFRDALLAMYHGEEQVGNDGAKFPTDGVTKIAAGDAMALFDMVMATNARNTLEIGMAYGFSTICFLAAIAENGAGHHIAIDPFQRADWNGIGLAHATALAPEFADGSAFTFLEDRSDRVSADLVRAGKKFDLIFIDGNHRFDDVLVDFYLYDQVCEVGGHIILDDMWMATVQTVVSFLETNRVNFERVPDHPRHNQAVFKKVSEDTRHWADFHPFSMGKYR